MRKIFSVLFCIAGAAAAERPNVVFILSDDIGYGDVGFQGATKVKTPNLDKLASQSLRFTDGHATSSTCTPSRYAIMTGEYPWRKKGTGVLPGDARLIIDVKRETLPQMFQKAGYKTGAVGKWHLGLGDGDVNWNGEIKPGAREVGFDFSCIMPATGDRVPCVFVENNRVANLDPGDPISVSYGKKIGSEPTGRENPGLLKMKLAEGHDGTIVNGISRIGFMSGGKSARWNDENLARDLTKKAVGFIEENKDGPFFLYLATHDIHVPRVPHPDFQGSSQCGVRGDVIQQLDATVADVLAALERLKIADNTIVIFSSDNGPVVDDGYADGAEKNLNGHKPAGELRGGKYTIWEGGTRVPFLVRWPGRVKPGVSDALVCQIDLLASFAAFLGQKVPEGAGPDSQNVMPALLGESKTGRTTLVEDSRFVALRDASWKFVPFLNGDQQLFDLASDIGESKNIATDHPDIVEKCAGELAKIRSTRDEGVPKETVQKKQQKP